MAYEGQTKEERIREYLTPHESEQILRILKGKCPHNKGWSYVGHGHNDETYRCVLCGKTKDY